MSGRQPSGLGKEIESARSVAALFGGCFRFAPRHLEGSDVAKLLSTSPGDLAALGWVSVAQLRRAADLVDNLASRAPRDRLRLRVSERDALVKALSQGSVPPARVAFLLAALVDARFASVEPRIGPSDGGVVAALPARFLGDAAPRLLPPPIGQMTPIAACRRWMRGFWFVGRLGDVDSFGALPQPEPAMLPSRTRETLQGAVEEGEVRLAAVSWPGHALRDLVAVPASTGCFAYAGAGGREDLGVLDRILEVLRHERVHLAVFPELAVSEASYEHLRAGLRRARARFPALLVVGRAHRPKKLGGHENLGVVLDAHGEEVLVHEKLEPFTDPNGLVEDLVPRGQQGYCFLDTPVGRLVVNVCRDVRADVPMFLNRALGASILVVPTHSRRLDFVVEEARVLGARQLAIVMAANARLENPGKSAPFATDRAAVLYVPIRGSGGTHEAPHLPGGNGTLQTYRVALGPGGIPSLAAGNPISV